MYQVAKSWCPTDTTDEFSMFLRFIGTELWYAYMCLFSLYCILCLWNLATFFQKHFYFYYGVHYCMYYNLFTLWMYLNRMEFFFFFFTKNKKVKNGAASVSLVPKNLTVWFYGRHKFSSGKKWLNSFLKRWGKFSLKPGINGVAADFHQYLVSAVLNLVTILGDRELHLTMVLITVSLVTNDTEILFMYWP